MNEDLFIKYHNELYRWCMIKTSNHFDAEDLLQDINYQLIIISYKNPIILDEKKFVFKVAYYTWCKKLRKKYKEKDILSLELIENSINDNTDILREVELSESLSFIKKSIDKLSEKQKKCMNLYYFGGLSIKEIANTLGIKENLVKYYLFQGRKKLRSELLNENI